MSIPEHFETVAPSEADALLAASPAGCWRRGAGPGFERPDSVARRRGGRGSGGRAVVGVAIVSGLSRRCRGATP